MRSPDATTDVAACLARISALEAMRRAALLQGCQPAVVAVIGGIVERQKTDALAFARRGAP